MGFDAKQCPLCGGRVMPPRYASDLATVDDPSLSYFGFFGCLDSPSWSGT